MATYNLGGAIRCEFFWTLPGGNRAMNVMHFGAQDAVAGQAEVQAAATAGVSLMTDNHNVSSVLSFLSHEVSFEGTHARTLDPANPLEADGLFTGVGLINDESVPLETSVVVSLRSSLASRNGRGRIFIPGLSRSLVDNGTLSAANALAIGAIFDDWIGDTEAAGSVEAIIWSPTLNEGHDLVDAIGRQVLHHQSRRNT